VQAISVQYIPAQARPAIYEDVFRASFFFFFSFAGVVSFPFSFASVASFPFSFDGVVSFFSFFDGLSSYTKGEGRFLSDVDALGKWRSNSASTKLR
jgi:hypothetical protein